jgi:6-phospho-beta-glucosidase
MQAVKAYERLTIQAVAEGSRAAAVHALAVHPLVADVRLAEQIVDGYMAAHGAFFPELR